jgi:Na+/melibiose symporter-like transporter
MDHLVTNLVLAAIVLSPVLLPALAKKWTAFWIALIGYAVYALWGAALYFTSDIEDYGTGYGLMIIPYIIVLTIVASQVQKRADKAQKK